LNGSSRHPAVPRTPDELARAAKACVEAGAGALHLHAFDDGGRESLEPEPCAAAVLAVRAACPGIPISLTTSAEIEPDPERRLQLVSSWTVMPDLVSANQGEPGIVDVCQVMIRRGVGIEAALLSVQDAHEFVRSGLVSYSGRVLVEPLDVLEDDAIAHAAAIEEVLARGEIALQQVHHGSGQACWAVNLRGLRRGHGIRTGLEDTSVLPDGRTARDNAQLVQAAVAMVGGRAGAY
jgi:uncharacterized protein (DUF849 family)